MKIKALKCTVCGGNIDRRTMTCEYCGCEYAIENDDVLRIVTYHAETLNLVAESRIPREDVEYYGERIVNHVVGDLSRRIADQLQDIMDVHTEYVPETMEYRINSRIKVIKPARAR